MVFSFLTSRLSVDLEKKDGYTAGDILEGKVKLHTLKGVDARAVRVKLCCAEWMNPKKDGGKEGEGKEIMLWEKEKKLGGAHKYRAGEWKFEFKIPNTAIPSITPEPYEQHPKEGGRGEVVCACADGRACIHRHACVQAGFPLLSFFLLLGLAGFLVRGMLCKIYK